jgi:hypothetical protein
MDIPALVRRELGDEDVRTAVALGDDDLLCVTPTRAIRYRGEGLLSDEAVVDYSLDVDRVEVAHGRRKATFTLTDIDGSESFSVPRDSTESALRAVLEGVLRLQGVVGADESVRGVYRFSELTLIVTDARLIKLVGAAVWTDDHEVYDYADVTGLEFEAGSVATQIILAVDGRPQRIKAPTDEAPKLRQTLEGALFEFFDVGSVAELNEAVEPAEGAADSEAGPSAELTLDSGIDPLVGDSRSDESTDGSDEEAADPMTEDQWVTPAVDRDDAATPGTAKSDGAGEADGTVDARLAELEAAVERQNELLERHQRTIERLIEELRQGR